jgi:hypothetical protein
MLSHRHLPDAALPGEELRLDLLVADRLHCLSGVSSGSDSRICAPVRSGLALC